MRDLAELRIAIIIWLGGALGALMAGVGHEPSRIRAYQRALRFDNRVRAMITHLHQSAFAPHRRIARVSEGRRSEPYIIERVSVPYK